MTGIFEQRIYLEDVDAMGCVYHANYIKFCERARTEMLRAHGFCHGTAIQEAKNFFVMRHIEIDYLGAAFLKDLIQVETRLKELKGASIIFEQDIFRDTTHLVQVTVKLVYVNQDFKVVRIPESLKQIFSRLGK